ncbi:hypothetical protein HMPREF3201_00387 [Megasphaera sp. MJR8396C]|nr:hypothetical protein HMPREF3201_00387 [Megasphaera sp. MJR8396C]
MSDPLKQRGETPYHKGRAWLTPSGCSGLFRCIYGQGTLLPV